MGGMSEEEYKKSLWPPGADLSVYTYSPELHWRATPDS